MYAGGCIELGKSVICINYICNQINFYDQALRMTKKIIKTIFWDLDGTLIDSEHIHANAALLAFNELKIPLISHEVTPGIENRGGFIEMTGLDLNVANNLELFNTWDKQIVEMAIQQVTKEDGIWQSLELLQHFHQLGLKQYVVSNSYHNFASHVLQQLAIEHLVDGLFSRDMVNNGKPHPELYNMAFAAQTNLRENCLAFEDSNTGLTAATAANVDVIAINNPNHTFSLNHTDNDWLDIVSEFYTFTK